MVRHLKLQSAKAELTDALQRHLGMLSNINLHCIVNNREKNEFLYLMAVPVIYAAWEGYFRISCSICLRRICYREKKAKLYPEKYAALWLQKESFVDSFLQLLFNSMQIGRPQKKLNAGKFNALAKFSTDTRNWLERPVNHLYNFDDLVMTYSNVNKEVALLNSEIIGFQVGEIDFSRLDELLNRRNEIAHGGIVDYPREQTINELLNYTRGLINGLNLAIIEWLQAN